MTERSTEVFDIVKKPSHYNSGKIEVWDFIIDQNLTYCNGNAVKYISRAGKKDPSKTVQDLEKAVAFLQREIKRLNDEAPDHGDLEVRAEAAVGQRPSNPQCLSCGRRGGIHSIDCASLLQGR